jgi:amidase
VRVHTVYPPGIIGGAHHPGYPGNTRPETYYGPNAGLTEILIPAGYVSVAYDPVYKLSADGKRYDMAASDTPTPLAAPGLPFSLVFRVEPGMEHISLKVASAYEAASKRRVPPPAFGPLIS